MSGAARVIYSGTRERLSDADRARVLAMMFARGGEHGVGDCPTGLDAFVRAALIEPPIVFAAEWDRLGKRAGPERNARMVRWAAEREGSILLAFPGPTSRGTWDCVRRAVAAGLRVLIEPVGRRT